MNLRSFAIASAVSIALVEATNWINHDQVVPFNASQPTSVTNVAAQIYQPQIYIHNGCHPYPAVDAAGNVGGGLKPTGPQDGDCSNPSLGSQVYGRSTWYKGVWAIMYSWYFPKDSPVPHFGHRHDWEHVIVWVDNPTNFPGKILAMTPSAHSGYSTYAPPDADMVGGPGNTNVKVEYTSSWIFINHHLEGTSHDGEYQALIMWDDMTDAARYALNTTDFGSANVPMSDGHFLPKLQNAYPFSSSS